MPRFPRHLARQAAAAAIVMLCTAAQAQSAEQALRPRTDATTGIEYVQGGAGEQEMQAVKAMQSQYPLHLVFSRNNGEYIVPDRVTVSSSERVVLNIVNAGPAVLAKLPPGRYTVQADYLGSTQRRNVDVGRESKLISWNWGAVSDSPRQ